MIQLSENYRLVIDGKEISFQEKRVVGKSNVPGKESVNEGKEIWKDYPAYFTKMKEALKFYCEVEMKNAESMKNLIHIINGLNDKIDILLSIKSCED